MGSNSKCCGFIGVDNFAPVAVTRRSTDYRILAASVMVRTLFMSMFLLMLLPTQSQVLPPLNLRMDPLHAMFLPAQTAEGASVKSIRQP